MTRPDKSDQHNLGAFLSTFAPDFAVKPLQWAAAAPTMAARKEALPIDSFLSEGASYQDLFNASHPGATPGGEISPAVKALLKRTGLDVGFLRTHPRFGEMMGGYIPQKGMGPLWRFGSWAHGIPDVPFRRHGMIASSNPEAAMPLEALAHELGHAQSWHGKGLPQILSRARMLGSPLLGAGALIEVLRGVTGSKSMEQRDQLLDTSSALAGARSVPVLADEFNASRNAMKLLRSLPKGMAENVLARAPKTLTGAGATYGLGALAGILAPQAAKWWYHRNAT